MAIFPTQSAYQTGERCVSRLTRWKNLKWLTDCRYDFAAKCCRASMVGRGDVKSAVVISQNCCVLRTEIKETRNE